jgi:hypothetical protein
MEIALGTGFVGGDLPDPSSFNHSNFDDPDGDVGPAGRGYFSQYGFTSSAPTIEQDVMDVDDDDVKPVDPDLVDMPNPSILLKKITQASRNDPSLLMLTRPDGVGKWKPVSIQELMIGQQSFKSDQFREFAIQARYPSSDKVTFLQVKKKPRHSLIEKVSSHLISLFKGLCRVVCLPCHDNLRDGQS